MDRDAIDTLVAAIKNSSNLDELCERLNLLESILEESIDHTPGLDLAGLPVFGPEPADTLEIWSWDETRVLRTDPARWWYLEPRDA